MEKRPEISFRCGPMALSRILASEHSPLALSPAIADSKSTMQGISLADVAALSRTLGMNYQPAKRTPGTPLIFPSVIHWKAGHYAALIKQAGQLYLTQDPTFGNETWHSQKALEEEASGYFLVPPGALPAGWSPVSEEEAKTVFGKGLPSGSYGGATGPGDKQGGGGGPGPNTCSEGMSTYTFHLMLASLRITDTPVFYHPPYGSPMVFTATYCQREANQPSNFNYCNLGAQWNFNWQSYITDDPTNPAASVTESIGGGGTYSYAYSGSSNGTDSFATQFDSYGQLSRPTGKPRLRRA
jgi:hypothetical protein